MIPINIKDTNEILTSLKNVNLDRLYLNDFNNTKSITNSNNNEPTLVNEHIYHDSCLQLENTEDIIFRFSTVDMRGFDKLEIAILSEQELDLAQISLYFSEFASADIPLESAQLNTNETIVNNKMYQFVFDLIDKEGAKYYLPNINSIKLKLGMGSDIKIANIMLKAINYSVTLDEVKNERDNAEKYILKRIPDDNVPDVLLDEIPKKAASMLWLINRQGKGESNVGSEVGKFSNKNFHDKLKLEVDEAISEYIGEDDTSSDDGKSSINTNLVGSI